MAQTIRAAEKLGGQGRPKKDQEKGDSNLYRAWQPRRLPRRPAEARRPDIAEAVERSEYRSIQAALAAGIIREPSPLNLLLRAWRKASAEGRTRFLAEIRHP